MTTVESPAAPLGAIILANGHADKLAAKVGASHKALLDLGGQPMVVRVMQALQASPLIGPVVVACLKDGPVATALRGQVPLAEATGETFLNGIEQGFAALDALDQALLVTCDMPLLSAEAVSAFAREVQQSPEMDLIYAMVDIHLVREAYPESQRMAVKLTDGHFTAAGVSAISRRFVTHCGPTLMEAFAARKSKLAMGRILGWSFLTRFALGLLSVEDIVRRAQGLLDCRAKAIRLPYPECGFDVDTLQDLESARRVFARS